MATYTSNYQLHQWVPGDNFLRTDFNTDFQKIDAAVKGVETAANAALALKADKTELTQACAALDAAKCEVLTGVYIGDGTTNRLIALSRTPRAVLIDSYRGTPEMPSGGLITIQENGFLVRDSGGQSSNAEGRAYYYIALT